MGKGFLALSSNSARDYLIKFHYGKLADTNFKFYEQSPPGAMRIAIGEKPAVSISI
jgi:hypothetical protein